MTMRSTLLSGIAGLAIASAMTFAAQAQTDAPPPAPGTTTNATGGQTPATAPSADPAKPRVHHHRILRGQSGPQDSTPAERAATDRLNDQQLAAVEAQSPPAAVSTGADQSSPPPQ